ncbi:hypothetical protein MKW94_007545 [Papaver nudicaule]|uniref:Uncharacterized protein n=1 Tax=Papaver nudicaule TaxID=74823 RepID=A0AA41RWZ8_PAPNU|nr:hypothetical protein [Papaver nudicaule]
MIDGGEQFGGLLGALKAKLLEGKAVPVRIFGTTTCSSPNSMVMGTRLDHHAKHLNSTTSTRGRKISRSGSSTCADPDNDQISSRASAIVKNKEGVQVSGPISSNLAVVAGLGIDSGNTGDGPAVHDPENLDHLMHGNENFIHA